MKLQTLIIRADASTQMGTGHVMRCLAIAQAWLAEDGRVHFLLAESTPALDDRLRAEGIQIQHLGVEKSSAEDAQKTIEQARLLNATTVVVDGYHFGGDYQKFLKDAGLKVLFLDDNGHANHYSADWVLNQNIHAQEGLYPSREAYTKLLLGTRFALLRKEFWLWRGWQRQIAPVARNILVTLGGSDPDNVTLKVIRALQKVALNDLTVIVVVGGSNPHYQVLQQAIQEKSVNIELRCNVTNMPDLMAWADVAIAAGGSTSLELAFMGLPSLLMVLAENQKLSVDQLHSSGAAVCLGWHRDIETGELYAKIKELLLQQVLRRDLSSNSKKLVDGSGSDRLMMFLQNQKLRLREVCKDDSELLWHWANDPSVRSVSFSSEWISWEEHQKWFSNKLKDNNSYIFIALTHGDKAIGQIRFTLTQEQEAEISVSVDSNQRGLGYGKLIALLGVKKIFKTTSVKRLYASVKTHNLFSKRVFEHLNFEESGRPVIHGSSAIRYVLKREVYELS